MALSPLPLLLVLVLALLVSLAAASPPAHPAHPNTAAHPLLISTAAQFSRRSRSRSDPGCRRGIKKDGACCPKKCGKCGGQGCGKRGKRAKTNCCTDSIKKNARPCAVKFAPCKLSGRPKRSKRSRRNKPSKRNRRNIKVTAAASLKGSWQFANVKSGALTPRHEACALMVRGLVVLLGGRGANKPVSVYNPKTGVWTNRNGPGDGIELHHMQCVATSTGKIYIPSSWTGGFPFEKNNDKVYIYDVVNNKWSTKPGLPEKRRRGGAAAVLRNGIIYIVGGNRGGHGGHAKTLGWMDSYNIAQSKWNTNLPTMPDGRDHTGGALVNGQLCVAGGRDGGAESFFSTNKKSTYCYDFGSKKWNRKGDFPSPRAGANTAAICGGKMMIAGGEGSGDASNKVHVFDGSSWKAAPSLVQKRHGAGLAVAKCTCGQIFIPSGSGAQGGSPELSSTERFVPAGKNVNCASY